jgi:hypothetical protein
MTGACAAAPVTSKLLPPVEIIGATLALTLKLANWSDRRPPHPVSQEDVLEIDACHWCC